MDNVVYYSVCVVIGAIIIVFGVAFLYAYLDNSNPRPAKGRKVAKAKYTVDYLDKKGTKRQMRFSTYNVFFDVNEVKSRLPKGSSIQEIHGDENNKTFFGGGGNGA
jgi:hypothetical protein